MLAVNEIYGPVVQGEGRWLGETTGFLRLMGCNLACTWCDTKYTWDATNYNLKEQLTKMTSEEVSDALMDLRVPRIDISGGEPMLQQDAILDLIRETKAGAYLQWSIETAGTIDPKPEMFTRIPKWNVSPKLDNSGNSIDSRRNWQALRHIARFAQSVGFKFVARNHFDFPEIDSIVSGLGLSPEYVYIMPEGVTAEAILEHSAHLLPEILKRGYTLTTRLHILMHGNKRGT